MMMRSPFKTNCMLHLLISNSRTRANDFNSGTIEGPFFWDMMLHQWVIGSQSFEGINYTGLKGLIRPRLQIRALCSLQNVRIPLQVGSASYPRRMESSGTLL